MITETQKQQFELKGYDVVFESRGEIIAVNSKGVKDWNSKKQREFFDKTGLSIFFEGDGNPVFYDSRYFKVNCDSPLAYLVYIGKRSSDIPQPINCHSMFHMFEKCCLESIDLHTWDMRMVYDISGMFENSKFLKSANLANWTMPCLQTTSYMFLDCYSMQSLDLTGWYVPKLLQSFNVFGNCFGLQNKSQKSLEELEEAFRNGNFGKV